MSGNFEVMNEKIEQFFRIFDLVENFARSVFCRYILARLLYLIFNQ